ncbi:endonuclease I family protein [Virgibacillus siamensis]|uniref:endonuclease I family protein n=1 Tax=Virgibacillus siamensis TaxID=480071 RepID=UPI0009863939|nr:endonuclease [Virgibacillus siamensis]
MNLTAEQKNKLLPVTTDQKRLHSIISRLTDTKEEWEKDEKTYYDKEKDQQMKEHYYQNIDFDNPDDSELLQSLKRLLTETHTNQVSYDPSEYVYPWVDLRPDGNLESIYSGVKQQPEEVIKKDHQTSLKRKEEMEKAQESEQSQKERKLREIADSFKYNCEHVVPQSWFNEEEPMRGDIHHLFTCEPDCNSIRSNYPYHDFPDYNPENMETRQIEDACGKADEELFEPENAKGAVARAMMYFLIRYPDEIEKSHRKKIDTNLLLDWHQKFPPTLYEKHRNQAIFDIQGNRNPYIDFPEEMKRFCHLKHL